MAFYLFETSLGQIGLEGESAITHLYLPGRPMPKQAVQSTPLFEEARRQILAYLQGNPMGFSLPLAPEGTLFQQQVWERLQKVPYGQTISYRQLAQDIGRPNAFRAVGGACNQNPIPLLIPCHRVLGAKGNLTGYADGLPLKALFLQLEGLKPQKG